MTMKDLDQLFVTLSASEAILMIGLAKSLDLVLANRFVTLGTNVCNESESHDAMMLPVLLLTIVVIVYVIFNVDQGFFWHDFVDNK